MHIRKETNHELKTDKYIFTYSLIVSSNENNLILFIKLRIGKTR